MHLQRLKELREDRHLSQQALADLVNTSQQNIHKYETGLTEPDIQMLKTLATVLHTSIDYLVSFDPEEYPELMDAVDVSELDFVIEAKRPDTSRHIDGDRLHLLASYDRCRPQVREHLLYIVDELGKMMLDKDRENNENKEK